MEWHPDSKIHMRKLQATQNTVLCTAAGYTQSTPTLAQGVLCAPPERSRGYYMYTRIYITDMQHPLHYLQNPLPFPDTFTTSQSPTTTQCTPPSHLHRETQPPVHIHRNTHFANRILHGLNLNSTRITDSGDVLFRTLSPSH